MKGQRVGYVRVSTHEQNIDRQLEGIELDRCFTDRASGKDVARPELIALKRFVREGDTVMVHSMDRLARNLDDLRQTVKELTARGVCIEFVKGEAMRVQLALGAAAIYSAEAWAATGSTPPQNSVGSGLFVALGIAYLARRKQIGGWLLYYYMQLYGSLLITALLLATTLSQLAPGGWESAKLYVWYVLSTVPVLMAFAAELLVATMMLFRRTESLLRLLRGAQVALVVASAASLAIDVSYFSESATIFFDVYGLFFAVVWALYFRKSKRVRQVFIEHNWNYEAQQAAKPAPTKQELRYLWKRAAISAGVTFVVLLVMMGVVLEDKPPEVAIFFVPLFYAAFAAVLGRYLPIRERKRAALAVKA